MIEIDGSYLEGGGQILRTAMALSAVTKKPCRIFNIRAGRPKPGLAAQHLWAIKAVAELSGGRLEGDSLGSKEITFWPLEISAKNITIKIETAGSITLVLQSLLPAALFSPLPIKIIFVGGATDTFFSPTLDYYQYVFLNIIAKMGVSASLEIIKRGYYPVGGANLEIKISPTKLKAIDLTERGNLKMIFIISGASDWLKNQKVAERQAAGAKEILGKLNLPYDQKIEYYHTACPGSQILCAAEFENTIIGADNLGKLGKRAEDVGKEAALKLLGEERSQACLDRHLADQILPFVALAGKESCITVSKITKHVQTNIWVIEKFLEGKFKINENIICWKPNK